MKLKLFSLITLLSGFLLSMIGIVAPFIRLQNYTSANGSIQIIGGADTPTYKFILFQSMHGWPFCLMLFGACLIVSALFCLIFTKTIKTNCSIKTSIISLGLSAVAALAILCVFTWYTIVVFHEISKHPVSYPFSVNLGILCCVVFVVLIVLYCKFRRVCWSIKGFVIDAFTSVIYLPAFFFTFSYLYKILSWFKENLVLLYFKRPFF